MTEPATPKVCVVTLTLGKMRETYERLFVPSIRAFAQKYNYDFKQLTEFMDTPKYEGDSNMIKKHCLHIQKLLIAQQSWVDEYDWIIIVDADILINYEKAPSIVDELVPGKICVVNERTLFENNDIMTYFWKHFDPKHPPTAQDYYPYLKFPESFDKQCNTGFVCFQPSLHKDFFKFVYDTYAPRIYAGEDLDSDQGPLNYEGNRLNLYHYLDERWNRVWLFPRFLFYSWMDPFYDKNHLQQAFKTIFDMSYCVHMVGGVDWTILE